jgi:hypothetical protein
LASFLDDFDWFFFIDFRIWYPCHIRLACMGRRRRSRHGRCTSAAYASLDNQVRFASDSPCFLCE